MGRDSYFVVLVHAKHGLYLTTRPQPLLYHRATAIVQWQVSVGTWKVPAAWAMGIFIYFYLGRILIYSLSWPEIYFESLPHLQIVEIIGANHWSLIAMGI